MSILDRYEEQAIDNVLESRDFQGVVIEEFGFAQVNSIPGTNLGNSSVEMEIDYEFTDKDSEALEGFMIDSPNADDIEKAIRSENMDLAEDLAEGIFQEAIDDFMKYYQNMLNRKQDIVKEKFNEMVSEQEVWLYANGYDETMTLYELYGERSYDEVNVDIYLGRDTTYFSNREQFVIDFFTKSLERRGLLDEPLEDEDY